MNPCRIFIVDDEPAIIEPLAYALTTEGFDVEIFALGQDLQRRIRQLVPDIIVLDVGLPDINGFELFRQLKAQLDIPILFLTARSDEIDRIVGLELGADDYVVKPFSPREVAARIRTIIRRCYANNALNQAAINQTAIKQPTIKQAIKQSHELKVDRETATAVYCGEYLNLTRYEFLILALLFEQPKRVYSREQMLNAVWPERSGSMERSVDTHIKTLRGKLKCICSEVELIKTHRGLGYSLELLQ